MYYQIFRGGNAYVPDKNTVQNDIEEMKAKEEELDNLILNTGMIKNLLYWFTLYINT